MQHDTDLAKNLLAIRARFIKRVAEWIPAFEKLWDDLRTNTASVEELLDLRMQAHKIAGSAHTFGFAGFTLLAAELEDQLDLVLENEPLDSNQATLGRALENFNVAAQQIAASGLLSEGGDPKARKPLNNQSPIERVIEPSTPGPTPTATRPPHIMIVDDDDLMRDLLKEGLSANGWTFSGAVDGNEAVLTLLEASGAAPGLRPDLILLDVDMPEMDGFETLRVIKASPLWRSTPVVMLTHRKGDASLIRGYTEGAQGYMTKPVDLDRLSRTIEDTLTAQSKRVVVAVGDLDTRDFLKSCLKALPVNITVVEDINGAVEQMSDSCSLVFVDTAFTKEDGRTMIEIAESDDTLWNIPIFSIEASGDRNAMLHSLSNGAHHSMMKPLDTEEVIARVKGILYR